MADISQTPLIPAVLRRVEAAAYCGRSIATWDRMVAAGLTPKTMKIGRSVLISRASLDQWIALGCPDRKTFELESGSSSQD